MRSLDPPTTAVELFRAAGRRRRRRSRRGGPAPSIERAVPPARRHPAGDRAGRGARRPRSAWPPSSTRSTTGCGLLAAAGAARDDRHGTMRATIEWSYRLLDADEQRMFRWLGRVPQRLRARRRRARRRARSGIDGVRRHRPRRVAGAQEHGGRRGLRRTACATGCSRRCARSPSSSSTTTASGDGGSPRHRRVGGHDHRPPVRRPVQRRGRAQRRSASSARRTTGATRWCSPPRLRLGRAGRPRCAVRRSAFFLLGRHDLADVVRPLLDARATTTRQRRAVLCALIVSASGRHRPRRSCRRGRDEVAGDRRARTDRPRRADALARAGLAGRLRRRPSRCAWRRRSTRGSARARATCSSASPCSTTSASPTPTTTRTG